MDKLTKDYKEYLYERLQDPEEAVGYLNATLEEDDPSVFLLALRYLADAQGIGKVAIAANLNRENLYRMLSDQGNPRISSLMALIRALGLKLAVEESQDAREVRSGTAVVVAAAASSSGSARGYDTPRPVTSLRIVNPTEKNINDRKEDTDAGSTDGPVAA